MIIYCSDNLPMSINWITMQLLYIVGDTSIHGDCYFVCIIIIGARMLTSSTA